jgi:hypothetical protein
MKEAESLSIMYCLAGMGRVALWREREMGESRVGSGERGAWSGERVVADSIAL